MRFESLRLRGLGPFREEVSLDLAALPGTLVAVIGDNGAGKSTLLELLAGSLYRETPTRGTLAKLATARDAFVEAKFVNGRPWTLRHTIDSVSGAGDSLVLDDEGAPAFDSAKRRAFDAWSAKHLPSKEVLYSSVFAPQGAGGFLDLGASDRKAVLLRCLGIERLEALSELAREHARAAKLETTKLRAQLDALDWIHVAQAEAELDRAAKVVVVAEGVLATARARQARVDAYLIVRDRIEPTRRQIEELEMRRANNALLLTQADEIRAAAVSVDAAQAEILALDPRAAAADREVSARVAAVAAGEATAGALAARRDELMRRGSSAEEVLLRAEAVAKAEERVAFLREAVAANEQAEITLRAEVDQLQERIASGAVSRVMGLRSALVGIQSSTRADSRARARQGLHGDDVAAAEVESAPAAVAQARQGLAPITAAKAAIRSDLAEAERVAAGAGRVAAARETLVEVRAAVALLDVEIASSRAALLELRSLLQAAQDAATLVATAKSAARSTVERLQRLAGRATLIDAAAEKIADYDQRLAPLRAELTRMEAVPAEEERKLVVPAEAELAVARARRERATVAVEQARASAARAEELAPLLAAAEEELADWSRLADDLGRTGLQEVEIDCAAPELTELTNDLLTSCIGSRWSVAFEAQRLSADGKRDLAGMDVQVLDTVAGRQDEARTFSPGERALLGEAVSLALTTVACRRAEAVRPTLVRDESGAPLDAKNALAWIAMLRRAAVMIGASKVLFVTHSPGLWSLADARIVVADGKVSVQ